LDPRGELPSLLLCLPLPLPPLLLPCARANCSPRARPPVAPARRPLAPAARPAPAPSPAAARPRPPLLVPRGGPGPGDGPLRAVPAPGARPLCVAPALGGAARRGAAPCARPLAPLRLASQPPRRRDSLAPSRAAPRPPTRGPCPRQRGPQRGLALPRLPQRVPACAGPRAR
jgi:translation initiation factor IF-2